MLDIAEQRARRMATPVLDAVVKSCCITCSSPVLVEEIGHNATARAMALARPELVGLIAGSLETSRGELDRLNKLIIDEGVRDKGGWSVTAAGLTVGHKKYVEVGDRHLFVLAWRMNAKLLVTRDGKILSGVGKLAPYECSHPDEFVRVNAPAR